MLSILASCERIIVVEKECECEYEQEQIVNYTFGIDVKNKRIDKKMALSKLMLALTTNGRL